MTIERTIHQLTSSELRIQHEIQDLRENPPTSEFELNQLVGSINAKCFKLKNHINDLIKQTVDNTHELAPSQREDFLLQLNGHRQIASELTARLRQTVISAPTLSHARSDRKNRQALGLQEPRGISQSKNSAPASLIMSPSSSSSSSSAPASRSGLASMKEHEELEALKRAHASLLKEVERSQAALMEFERSSSTLKETRDEFKGQSDTMSISRRLANKLKQRDFTDRILLLIGVVFVALVSLSIVKSRLMPSGLTIPSSPVVVDGVVMTDPSSHEPTPSLSDAVLRVISESRSGGIHVSTSSSSAPSSSSSASSSIHSTQQVHSGSLNSRHHSSPFEEAQSSHHQHKYPSPHQANDHVAQESCGGDYLHRRHHQHTEDLDTTNHHQPQQTHPSSHHPSSHASAHHHQHVATSPVHDEL